MAGFDIETYATVQERLAEFYRDYPDGSIRTRLVRGEPPEAVFEARVYRTPDDSDHGIYTSGWAREVEGTAGITRTSHLETSETSAIGRALQNLGYSSDKRRPGREELVRSKRDREETSRALSPQGEEHDALLEAIRTRGPEVADDAEIEVGEETRNLKAYVRENWGLIKDKIDVARGVVTALDAAAKEPPGTSGSRRSGRGGERG